MFTLGEKETAQHYYVVSTLGSEVSMNSDTVDYNAIFSSAKQEIKKNINGSELPTEFSLDDNYPNPFNPITTVHYALPKDSYVRLAVYTTLGKEVAVLVEGFVHEGFQSVTFDASSLPSGVYFYRLQAGTFSSMKKMVLAK